LRLYPGHSRDVGLVASSHAHQGRYTIIVEEDIDPSNIEQVIWAIVTRGKPDQSIQILHHCRSNSSDPTIPLEEKKKYLFAPKPIHNSRVIIDACRPLEWKADWYPIARLSPELQARILDKWQDSLADLLSKAKVAVP
jgi:3-polyprenyl-4-hydroxybenzoate decarboxylase